MHKRVTTSYTADVLIKSTMTTIKLKQASGDFGFEIKDEAGHILQTDTSSSNGGGDAGFRPMQLLLAALGSCSAIDVVSILKKQRQKIDDLQIEVKGEREEGAVPSLWKTVVVTVHLSGQVDQKKAERAVTLSIEKYCSVAETLRRGGTTINWQTIVNKNT